MSADNGIYIAGFDDGYRIIHAQAIDNLNYYPVDSKEYILEWRMYFKNAIVVKSKSEAYEIAKQIATEYPILEYGIQFLGEMGNILTRKTN